MIHFRQTEPDDLVTIAGWIAQDKGHRGMDASFFVAHGMGVSCYCIEDEAGPVIFVCQEAEGDSTRLHTQFPPDSERKRIAKALSEAYPIVAKDAKVRGFKRVLFRSRSLALIRFMLKFDFAAELAAEL